MELELPSPFGNVTCRPVAVLHCAVQARVLSAAEYVFHFLPESRQWECLLTIRRSQQDPPRTETYATVSKQLAKGMVAGKMLRTLQRYDPPTFYEVLQAGRVL